MFKLLMNLFFDITGAIFFILKIVVVGIGKVFAFFVDAVVSSAGSSPGTDCAEARREPARYDICSIRAEDRFLTKTWKDQN